MSEHDSHGRGANGKRSIRQEDVDDLLADPSGPDVVRDDVRLAGAIADIGPEAGLRAQHIGELIDENREDVNRVTGHSSDKRRKAKGARKR